MFQFQRMVFCFLMAIGLTINVRTVNANISGKVSNQAGNPIANAMVTLMGQGIKDTTGSDGVFLIATAGVLYFIYLNYLRYLISDSEEVALRYLNLGSILADYSYFAGGAGLVILVLLIIFFRMHTLPPLLTRTIKGGFVFSAGFMLLYLITNYIPISYETRWNEVIDSSTHKFLKVLEDNSSIFSEPSLEGSTLARMPAGHVLLNTGSEEIGSLMWSRVLLGTQRYGWIVHVSPPQMGIPEKKVSSEFRFYFRYKDLYVFITGLICCVGGFWRFRIRPV